MSHAGEGGGRTKSSGAVVYRSNSQEDQKLSTSVLEALDSVPGYDVESSDTVVFDHVDLDALDELFTATNGTSPQGEVTFAVGEYHVTATAAGEVVVRTS
ncbi:HalOD1 output domain-containing protein [Natronomonas sp.]|uniref:HalOD1 output domain-containing protein n=1 Tax=Natronomonas sp. TaxID=2184060 RepID=UPI002FC3628D